MAVSATWAKGTSKVKRVLLIDPNVAAARRLGLRCLEKRIAVVIAENVCEAVRTLATTPVALIVVDIGRLRLGVRHQAALFDRIAPSVPVIVTVGPDVSLEVRAALELGGFRVIPAPAEPDEILKSID
jgi:DNA-binding NtrC family response regulator